MTRTDKRTGERIHVSRTMLALLERLYLSQGAGIVWVDCSTSHPLTRMALVQRDWIAPLHLASTTYRITKRGERVYRLFAQPGHRSDGICPRCGTNPRAVSRGGRMHGYCNACQKELQREYYFRTPTPETVNVPCAKCGAAPRSVTKSNRVRNYCADCYAELRRKHYEARKQMRLALAQAGRLPACAVEGCDQPVHATANHVSDCCKAHHAARTAEKRRRYARRHIERMMAQVRRKGAA